MTTSQKHKYGLQDFHAKMSLWRAQGQELGLEGNELDCFMNLLSYLAGIVPEQFFSKTSQVFSIRTKDEILESSFKRWPTSGMAWGGVCLTVDTSEYPSLVNESTLLDAITTQDVPQKYFLSPNAARGILRRVEGQGRKLFPPLLSALKILAVMEEQKE